MFDRLDALLAPPPMDESSGTSFWVDEHISGELLKVHLDPDDDLASRRPCFMDRSVAWIARIAPPDRFPRLLDLGCGPGLYAERFVRAGYEVTGIDFSPRSIAHARESARSQGLAISYACGDYLSATLPDPIDLAVLIYCDFGVLSAADRHAVLRRVHSSLRPGGHLLLDVHSPRHYAEFAEGRTWEVRDEGFWSPERHLAIEAHLKYPELTTLHRAVVLTRAGTRSYNIWTHCFTPESLAAEVEEAGFRVLDVLGDVAGTPYTADSTTLAVLLER
jgi:SAM-dependent methyltransferase